MRVVLLNTGTELLLGDVQDAHLAFIAREIFALGLRIEERSTVADGPAIRPALEELFRKADVVMVTGGLGPTTDDITREVTAELLGLELRQDAELLASLKQRLATRRIKWTERIARQANVPAAAQILPNQNGSAPGFYFEPNISPKIRSPHLFLLPGPPRELQPMFRDSVMPILRKIAGDLPVLARKFYKLSGTGESLVEEAIGEKLLAIPGIELGYCARPGEVDVRIIGDPTAVERADKIVRSEVGSFIFATGDESLEEVLVKFLTERKQTLAVTESCTGGLLANRVTNVPGASVVFLAGYIVYANEAKTDLLGVDPKLIAQHGAVSEQVARAMAEGARRRAGSTYALATTGVAGPGGGSTERPVGTVYIALAVPDETVASKLFFPGDRETFKQLTAQTAFEMLRKKIM